MCSHEGPSAPARAARRHKWLRRLWPAAVLAVVLVAILALGLDDYLSFEALRDNREALIAWVERAGWVAVFAFAGIYALAVAVSLPAGALLTLTAGFLFGPVLGTISVVCGATAGATAIFLAARTAFGRVLRAGAGKSIDRVASGFEEDAFSYLLTLRLIPIFPFWLVNVAPAFTRISVRSYVIATALGIVPATIVYVLIGNGLGAVLEAGESPDLDILFDPAILLPITGLALLSLLPVVYRRSRRRRGSTGEPPPSRPATSASVGASVRRTGER